jgi:hypothetical protein
MPEMLLSAASRHIALSGSSEADGALQSNSASNQHTLEVGRSKADASKLQTFNGYHDTLL